MFNHWVFKCQEVNRKLSYSMDRKLSFSEKAGVRFHLLMCKFCNRYQDHLLTLRELMHMKGSKFPPADAHLSQNAKERIKESLYKEMFKSGQKNF